MLKVRQKLVNKINKYMFSKLVGVVSTHFIRENNETSFVAQELEMLPVKIFMHNMVDDSFAIRKITIVVNGCCVLFLST